MDPVFQNENHTIYIGDAQKVMRSLPANSVDCFITSPPYWHMRDYKTSGQLGVEADSQDYVERLSFIFDDVWNVLKPTGTAWLNIGDTYFNKSLSGIPWRVALALQEFGWYIRSDIIWHKSNGMPHGVKDRPVGAHEYLFLLTKQPTYYYDNVAIMEKATGRSAGNKTHKYSEKQPGLLNIKPALLKNKRDVWTIGSQTYKGSHTAIFPEKLVEPCILAGCPEGGVVLDCFAGTGTVGVVAQKLKRKSVLIEINEEYLPQMKNRLGL